MFMSSQWEKPSKFPQTCTYTNITIILGIKRNNRPSYIIAPMLWQILKYYYTIIVIKTAAVLDFSFTHMTIVPIRLTYLG